MPQLLFVVDDTLFIKKRGLGLLPGFPGVWGDGEAAAGDMVELRAAGSAPIVTRIKGLDWQPRGSADPNRVKSGWIGFVLVDLPPGSAKPGDEVWTL